VHSKIFSLFSLLLVREGKARPDNELLENNPLENEPLDNANTEIKNTLDVFVKCEEDEEEPLFKVICHE
jgi:hypothetical protein